MSSVNSNSKTAGSQGNTAAKSIKSVNNALHHDFCPWANKYVYWLKEPVGWFVLATMASVLVGCFLSPLGWSMAAGLLAILALGLGFPWLVMKTVSCELVPTASELHEHDNSSLELRVQNRLPLPVFGLMLEGYLSQPLPDDESASGSEPDVGLARIPPLSTASYRLPIQPDYRGRYPVCTPKIACAFPFGIWTARRGLENVRKVTVRPLLIPVSGSMEFSGVRITDVGQGKRPTTQGDFLGVRDFRRGDSLRSIHWVQSAKLDEWVVCERGGPQQQAVEIHLFTHRCQGTTAEARENLAWRVRVAASLIDLLAARHLPFQLFIDEQRQALPEGASGCGRAWDLLAAIPLDSDVQAPSLNSSLGSRRTSSRFLISAVDQNLQVLPSHELQIAVEHPTSSIRDGDRSVVQHIDLDSDITSQLNALLLEVSRDSQAA